MERGKKPKKQMEILKREQQQTPRRKRFFASRWDYPIILIECVFLYLSRTSEHPCPEMSSETQNSCKMHFKLHHATYIAMENAQVVDVFPIGKREFLPAIVLY